MYHRFLTNFSQIERIFVEIRSVFCRAVPNLAFLLGKFNFCLPVAYRISGTVFLGGLDAFIVVLFKKCVVVRFLMVNYYSFDTNVKKLMMKFLMEEKFNFTFFFCCFLFL